MSTRAIQFPFEADKGLETLVYAASRVKQNDLYKTLKVLYWADKLHLERYGRFIYGERYSALPHGPVPQAAYDAVRVLNGERADSPFAETELRRALQRTERRLLPLRDPDVETLSESDVACLDEAIRACYFDSFERLKAKSHDAAYLKTPANGTLRVEDIIATLPAERQQALLDYLLH